MNALSSRRRFASPVEKGALTLKGLPWKVTEEDLVQFFDGYNYIPESLKSQVVAATALLGPKKSEEIILKDLKAGEYPYVCSFPAHFAVGMKGVLIVK